MPSGFGMIFATNITPDPDDGIGRWSAEDFWRALHDGTRRDGQQLYPAMPYTSYRGMTRADADAIYGRDIGRVDRAEAARHGKAAGIGRATRGGVAGGAVRRRGQIFPA